ncbi:MAG: exonuclease domain-containing protein [Crocinitomicaceae bacterium]|nr:exonuclease domain-containing protein [Crocinitomicaceae bacterium]
MNYAIVDIETTGGSPKSSKITEIAIYKHDGKEVIDEYVTLIDPEMPIPPFIVNLTGINDAMVKDSPKFYEIAKDIVEFTKDCIFVAHNVGFDYGIIRHEFRSLGFDYRRPHLCTVRASRYVLPGHDSYSLGKLTRSLGIELIGRHRAGGDALATAKLFTILMETDKAGLATFVQEELNPKRLHPNLDLDVLEEIPNKAGVYRFFNETNQLIYIGKSIHIKKRIEQHLRNNKTKKGIEMQREISRIEFELTGSELIALLLESQLIKQHQPIYNRALRKNKFPYGLYHYNDSRGYIQLHIAATGKMQEAPLLSFSSKKDGTNQLERMIEDFELCQKLCNTYKTQSSCFRYEIKECYGACVQEESTEDYNARCSDLIDDLMMNKETFYVVDKGRSKGEKSLVYVEAGSLRGYGYAPYHFHRLKPNKWNKFIDLTSDDRDARTILKLFLRKNTKHEVVHV